MRSSKDDVQQIENVNYEEEKNSPHKIKLPIKFKNEISIPEFNSFVIPEIKEKEKEIHKIKEISFSKNKEKKLW